MLRKLVRRLTRFAVFGSIIVPLAVHAQGDAETGLAAVYNDKLNGHTTACGERYNRNALTTAHASLPCNTLVRLTSVKNNRRVTVRVNDRGPTQAGRIVDISPRAAKVLGMPKISMFEVKLAVVGKSKKTGVKRHRP